MHTLPNRVKLSKVKIVFYWKSITKMSMIKIQHPFIYMLFVECLAFLGTFLNQKKSIYLNKGWHLSPFVTETYVKNWKSTYLIRKFFKIVIQIIFGVKWTNEFSPTANVNLKHAQTCARDRHRCCEVRCNKNDLRSVHFHCRQPKIYILYSVKHSQIIHQQ